MVLQNPFQFNLVENLKIHMSEKHLLLVYCVPGAKLDLRSGGLKKPGNILAQMEFTFKEGDGQQIQQLRSN